MATIDAASRLFTLINTFEVEPANAERLAEMLVSTTRDTMLGRPGFVSASIHVSADATRVVNYAQWATKADFDAMRADPAAQAHMRACGALAVRFDPSAYRVVDSIVA